MRQPSSSVLPEIGPHREQPRRSRAPVVERIAGWNARHRKTAVLGWLVLVAAFVALGYRLPTKNLPSYDAGQSGQAEQTLQRLGVTTPPQEYVLIQSRGPGRPGSGLQLRQAVRQVVAALSALPHSARDIRSPAGPGHAGLVAGDGRSALVTFGVPGNLRNEDQAVAPAVRAVAGSRRAIPVCGSRRPETRSDRALSTVLSRASAGPKRPQYRSRRPPAACVRRAGLRGHPAAAGGHRVVTALSLLTVVSRWLPVSASTSEVVLIVGMAVGVDYSLFYLRREREERARGGPLARHCRLPQALQAGRSWYPG